MFSVNKETKFGYQPSLGLVNNSAPCVLVECDPEETARSNCERRCFSDPKTCECRCPGMCYDDFCECGSPEVAQGDYQQYLSIPTAYNFGDPKRVCPTPEAPFMTMEGGSGEPPPDCNCQKCPEPGKPNPDPNAKASECCKDTLESEGPCTCSKFECEFLITEGNKSRWVKIKQGETYPYVWIPDPNKPGCYRCSCPTGLAPPDKKFWRCPQDGEQGCQETTEPKGTFETPEECQQKLQAGECQKKFVGLWNGDGYTCREKPQNFPWIGTRITEYDSMQECNAAVAANQGSCGAQRLGSSTWTGLNHCSHKWLCDGRSSQYGSPWSCTKYPFFNNSTLNSDIHDSEEICRQNCCNAQYDDSFGRCSYDLDTLIPGWGCVVESKSDCLKRPGGRFSCGDCDLLPEGRECVGGTPTCNKGQKIAYEVYPTGLFTSELRCRCVAGPAQNENPDPDPTPDPGPLSNCSPSLCTPLDDDPNGAGIPEQCSEDGSPKNSKDYCCCVSNGIYSGLPYCEGVTCS